MKEYHYDKLLNINTGGYQKETRKSFHYHPYEPTQYSALETLFEQYDVKSSDRVVDFGCGKGRLNFYINYFFDASVVGVEMNAIFYQIALENQLSYLEKHNRKNVYFHCGLAESYEIDPRDNRFYFFNPFSKEIFIGVVNNILRSVEESKRQVDIILYYPPDDYVYFLENDTAFTWKKEIRLDNYDSDVYERFLVYGME